MLNASTVKPSIPASPHLTLTKKSYVGPQLTYNKKTSDVHDKYELDLRFHARHKHKMAKAKDSNILKLWDVQNKDKYGFIPIQDQILPEIDSPTAKNPKTWDDHVSSDVVRFYLGPLFQGQTRIAKLKSAHNLLIIGPRVLGCEIDL